MNEPTDAEIEAAWTDATGSSILPYPDEMLAFARAVLAKWGQPQAEAGGEPVGKCCYGGSTPKSACASCAAWAPPPKAVLEPLTREQVKAIMAEAGYDREAPQPRADFITGLRHGERAHGIAKGGQHGAE